jgi:hypothetical protein
MSVKSERAEEDGKQVSVQYKQQVTPKYFNRLSPAFIHKDGSI